MRGATLFQITRWSFYSKTERISHSCDVLSMSDHKRTTSYTDRRCEEALKSDLSLTGFNWILTSPMWTTLPSADYLLSKDSCLVEKHSKEIRFPIYR